MRSTCEEGVVILARRDDRSQCGTFPTEFVHARQQRRIDNQCSRLRMIQDVHKFIPREPRVDGDKHGAGHGHAEVGGQQRFAVERKECHAIARLNACCCQTGGHGSSPLVNLTIGEMSIVIDDGGSIGKHASAPFQK